MLDRSISDAQIVRIDIYFGAFRELTSIACFEPWTNRSPQAERKCEAYRRHVCRINSTEEFATIIAPTTRRLYIFYRKPKIQARRRIPNNSKVSETRALSTCHRFKRSLLVLPLFSYRFLTYHVPIFIVTGLDKALVHRKLVVKVLGSSQPNLSISPQPRKLKSVDQTSFYTTKKM